MSPDCATQRVAARFIEKGYLKDHIARIIDLYRPRRDAMLDALNTTPCGPTSDPRTRIVWKKLKSRRSILFNPIQALFFATRKRVIPGIKEPSSRTEKPASSSFLFNLPGLKDIVSGENNRC